MLLKFQTRFSSSLNFIFLIIILCSSVIHAANYNVVVTLVSGATNQLMPGYSVSVYEQIASSEIWIDSATSNENGDVLLNLEGVNTGRQYFLGIHSPFDNRYKKSDLITTSGNSTFTVGNALLKAKISSGIGDKALTNRNIIVYKRLMDGSLSGISSEITDSNGYLNLDLPGLGKGTDYVLRAQHEKGSGWVYSADIKYTGNYAFKVGNTRVKVINGQTNRALSHYKIDVHKHSSDGNYSWYITHETDVDGFVDFQLADLESGEYYTYNGLSPADNVTWYRSEKNYQKGSSTFVVGNKFLNVMLVNALDQKSLSNIEVTAYQRQSDNSLKWFQKNTTNSSGRINFELEGLGNGSDYVLITSPYGVKISTQDITEPGEYEIKAGSVAVTLRRESDASMIEDRKLYLFEKTASGQSEYRADSHTDEQGIVRFDPGGLESGNVYFIYGYNLLGNNRDYYSQWITSKGQLDFIIDPDGLHVQDKTPPVFNTVEPKNNQTIGANGFILNMQISDNDAVKSVAVRIVDPVKGTTSSQASYLNNKWNFSVTADMISGGHTVMVEAEAEDKTGNKANLSYQFNIINDTDGPSVNILSHKDGDSIDENGFLLTGTAMDNSGAVQLLATVKNSFNTILINQKELEIGEYHHWALVAKNLPAGQDIKVELTAIDSTGNESVTEIALKTLSGSPDMIQLINRLTFGATPELIKELRELGANNFIQQQLHPELIDDWKFQQKLDAALEGGGGVMQKLQNTQIARAIYSKHQLLEVMTQFWDSHFNTDAGKVNHAELEEAENKDFRQHALGNFRDLLQISATSPAMIVYLDNQHSIKDAPNENYARELMELHTLGVDNGYTLEDIVEVARVFTGWTIHYGVYDFQPWFHDSDEKTVLGTVIPAGLGVEGGEMVLDLLAKHQNTAKFICSKLLKVFVSQTPAKSTVDDCAADFLSNVEAADQIAQVLAGIFNSAEFSKSLHFHSKVKTPLEFFAGLARQFPVSINYYEARKLMANMDMPLFYYPQPTGWPESGEYWINSNQLMVRWGATREIIFNQEWSWQNHMTNPSQFFIDQDIETVDGVLGFIFELAVAHDYSAQEWNAASALLTQQQTEKFDIYAPDADTRIRQVLALILQYPAYQLQ